MSSELCFINDEIADTLPSQIALLKKSMIKYIELRSIDGMRLDQLSDSEVKAVYRGFQRESISIYMIDTQIGKIDSYDYLYGVILKYISISEICHCSRLRVFSNFDSRSICKSIVMLQKAADMCSESHIELLLENEINTFASTPEQCALFINTINRNNLRMLFDTGNCSRANCDITTNMNAYKQYINHIHLSEYSKLFQQYVLPGADESIYRSILNIIQNYMDLKVITLELHRAKLPMGKQFTAYYESILRRNGTSGNITNTGD